MTLLSAPPIQTKSGHRLDEIARTLDAEYGVGTWFKLRELSKGRCLGEGWTVAICLAITGSPLVYSIKDMSRVLDTLTYLSSPSGWGLERRGEDRAVEYCLVRSNRGEIQF